MFGAVAVGRMLVHHVLVSAMRGAKEQEQAKQQAGTGCGAAVPPPIARVRVTAVFEAPYQLSQYPWNGVL